MTLGLFSFGIIYISNPSESALGNELGLSKIISTSDRNSIVGS